MGISNIKYQISKFSIYYLLSSVLLSGCGKKLPIGYEIIKDREGKIKNAFCKITSYAHKDTFAYGTSSLLFAGKDDNNEFEAMSFIQFKFDSMVKPETLWITGNDSGKIDIFKADSINFDSLDWSGRPVIDLDNPFVSINVREDSAIAVYVGTVFTDSDSVFCLALTVNYDEIINLYSYNCMLSIEGDSINKYKPVKSTYIDTSYLSVSELDSSVMVQTGRYVTLCTLYVHLFLIDSTDTFTIDSLSDSLRTFWHLDSATVNKAVFTIPIDTSLSYEEVLSVYPEFDSTFCSGNEPVNDTLSLYLDSIADKWFKEGEKLWIVLRGDSKNISRLVMDIKNANLSITYSLPPKIR